MKIKILRAETLSKLDEYYIAFVDSGVNEIINAVTYSDQDEVGLVIVYY